MSELHGETGKGKMTQQNSREKKWRVNKGIEQRGLLRPRKRFCRPSHVQKNKKKKKKELQILLLLGGSKEKKNLRKLENTRGNSRKLEKIRGNSRKFEEIRGNSERFRNGETGT
ncbi:hypothetical protein POVWA2_041470 [Plasmodium ovale wallikeri]|uniref:Uncharacterized protein n=1 Tax=Plasmodium ovale wallikeri TaxID=864142 RepID=A0A1A8ZBI9_PLAOA|nr:hypothetical protein POVWA1_042990 [Plasmodium ovale wallikeri]SBT41236.1 hypothetical protein POVWA2_041470 [Plasmodium ovale wallikeri]